MVVIHIGKYVSRAMFSAATASLFHADTELRSSLWSSLAGLILWCVLMTGADTGRGSGGALVVVSVAMLRTLARVCGGVSATLKKTSLATTLVETF